MSRLGERKALRKAKIKRSAAKFAAKDKEIEKGLAALPIDVEMPSKRGAAAPPSLLDTVIEMYPYTRREELVRLLCPRFNVVSRTIDRALAKARALAAEKYGDKSKLLQDGMDFLDRIARRAYKEGKHHAARGAVMDQQKLVGNTRPDVVIIGSMEAPAEDQLKLADELRRKIELASQQKRGKQDS